MPIDLDYSDAGSDWIKRKTLVCVECGDRAVEGAPGWRLERVDEDGDSGPLGAFCPACWSREFGRSG